MMMDEASATLVIFSGGTAFNPLRGHIKAFTKRVSYVLPVSDNGGSTAEIVRYLGGPAIGDIRSTLVRLSEADSKEMAAVVALLQSRLPLDPEEARRKWHSILDGHDEMWVDISYARKQLIRPYFLQFHTQLIHVTSTAAANDTILPPFSFSNGSVGNFFFTGVRLFSRSLESAILLWRLLVSIPETTAVLPCILTDNRLDLVAVLDDEAQTRVVGQNAISHPSTQPHDIVVDKDGAGQTPLPHGAHISRICYLNDDRVEVHPAPNPAVLDAVARAHAIVYAVGSLFTSIVPSLILPGVGAAIVARQVPKIFMLNGFADRETHGMAAMDYVRTVARACRGDPVSDDQLTAYVTHMMVVRGCTVPVDRDALAAAGIAVVDVERDAQCTAPMYAGEQAARTLHDIALHGLH